MTKHWLMTVGAVALLSACVTINVYFPAAAAERAADEFIQDVLSDTANGTGNGVGNGTGELLPAAAADSHWRGLAWIGSLPLRLLASDARAQVANIDINTPEVNAIKQRMAARQRSDLALLFDQGAIGFSNDGLIRVRDRSAVGLQQRRQLERLVAEENRDREAVYREIAIANGHPEWEDEIRATFARRWVSNARSGWYYQDAEGNWVQKS